MADRPPRGSRIAIAAIALSFFALPQPASPQNDPAPGDLIRRVIHHELSAQDGDHSHWMFRLETANKNGQPEVDEVLETKNGDLKLPILIDGHELTAKQRQESENRLREGTEARRKAAKEDAHDTAQGQQMLRMLPDAFIYTYGDRHGDLVQLLFKPNSKFQPHSHEQEVFHAMQGFVWVDAKQNRLAEISGRLTERVKFAGGLLGHLDPGGTFDVKQAEVAPEYWEVTVLDVQMRGKALFFKTIGVHEKSSRTAFKRVPDDLPTAQAIEMLKQSAYPQVSRR